MLNVESLPNENVIFLGRHFPSSVPTNLQLVVVQYSRLAVTVVPAILLTSLTTSFVGTTSTGAAEYCYYERV